jgi:hypothetical protein
VNLAKAAREFPPEGYFRHLKMIPGAPYHESEDSHDERQQSGFESGSSLIGFSANSANFHQETSRCVSAC